MIDITQPMPRNIGRRKAHNVRPTIAPIIPTNQRIAFLFGWTWGLKLCLDYLCDCSFSSLRRFFICISPSVSLAWHPKSVRREKEMFGLGMKNTTDSRELWRFFITKQKEYLRRRTFHKASKLKSLVDWTIIRSIESGTVKTYSHIISDENKSPMA